jgi:F0F1-type ATP synthase delta subunit
VRRKFSASRWAEAFCGSGERGGGSENLYSAAELRDGLLFLQAILPVAAKNYAGAEPRDAASHFTKAINSAAGLEFTPYERAASLARLLILKGHIAERGAVEAFLADLEGRVDKLEGIVTVRLESAVEPDEAFIEAVKSKIKESTGAKEVKVVQKTEISLMGGFRLSLGSRRVDCSLRGKFLRLEKVMGGYGGGRV